MSERRDGVATQQKGRLELERVRARIASAAGSILLLQNEVMRGEDALERASVTWGKEKDGLGLG